MLRKTVSLLKLDTYNLGQILSRTTGIIMLGTADLIISINLIKRLYYHEPISSLILATFFMTTITLISVFSNDHFRHIIGKIWFILTGTGFIATIVGLGVQSQHLSDIGMPLTLASLFCMLIVFFPDLIPPIKQE